MLGQEAPWDSIQESEEGAVTAELCLSPVYVWGAVPECASVPALALDQTIHLVIPNRSRISDPAIPGGSYQFQRQEHDSSPASEYLWGPVKCRSLDLSRLC